MQSGIRGNRHQGRSGPKRPETFKACKECTQFFPQRENWPPTASSGSVGSVVTLRPQTIDKYGRTVAEMFRNGQNVNLAMVSSGAAYPLRGPAATPTGSIWAPAMAPPTWGMRLQRNGSGSACGLCLGGSSGRGIGARAPACLPQPLPPPSLLLLDPPRLSWPLLAAPAAGSSIAGRSAALPAPRSC